MTVKNDTGTALTKSQVQDDMTDVSTDSHKIYQYSGVPLYEHFTLPGVSEVGSNRRQAFVTGQTYSGAEINRYYTTDADDPIRDGEGTAVTQEDLMDDMEEVTPDSHKVFRFDGEDPLYGHYTLPGKSVVDGDRRQLFIPGQIYTQGDVDRAFPAAQITSLVPSSGPEETATPVVAYGQHLTGVTAVSVGGSAATGVTVVNANELHFTTPDDVTAGSVNVVITDDSGEHTFADAFTFTS